MFDVMKYAKPEKRDEKHNRGYDEWFAFAPDEVYPATFARIREVLDKDEYPWELYEKQPPKGIDPNGVCVMYRELARALPREVWEDQFDPRALEHARLWFTQALHVSVNAPVGVHRAAAALRPAGPRP